MLPTDPSQADKSIVALMHGIKKQESGNDYERLGDKDSSGNFTAAGAGQWSNQVNGKPQPLKKGQIPINFQGDAKTFGLDPNDFSPENQNKVIYSRIADRKAKGYSPEQIVSEWNSGDKDKYLNAATSTGTGAVGKYDVGKHVKNVMSYAQEYAGKAKTPKEILSNVSVDSPVPAPVETPKSDTLSKLGGISSGILGVTGGNKIAESIGATATKAGILTNAIGAKEADYSKATPEALARMKAKGIPTSAMEQRKETAGRVTAPTTGETVMDELRLGTTIASLMFGGGALQALKGPTVAKQAMTITEATTGIGPKILSGMNNEMKFNTITQALKSASPSQKLTLTKELVRLAPLVEKEMGASAFAKAFPWLAKGLETVVKTPGLLYKAGKFAVKSAPYIGGGALGFNEIKKALLGDSANKSK